MEFLDLMKEITSSSYKEKTKKIGKMDIVLRNLSAKEEAEVYTTVGNLKGTEFFYVLKLQTLARAMVAIKKEDEEEKRFEKEDLDAINSKIENMTQWPATIIDELYKAYSDLSNEIDKELGFETTEDKDIEAFKTVEATQESEAKNAVDTINEITSN